MKKEKAMDVAARACGFAAKAMDVAARACGGAAKAMDVAAKACRFAAKVMDVEAKAMELPAKACGCAEKPMGSAGKAMGSRKKAMGFPEKHIAFFQEPSTIRPVPGANSGHLSTIAVPHESLVWRALQDARCCENAHSCTNRKGEPRSKPQVRKAKAMRAGSRSFSPWNAPTGSSAPDVLFKQPQDR